MTVGSQVRQTLVTLKSTKASLEIYLNKEQNHSSRDMLEQTINQLNQVVSDLDERVNTLEFQEPQYKGM